MYKDTNPETLTMRYTITVKRKLPPSEGHEGIDWLDVGNISITIARQGVKTKFKSCHVDYVTEEFGSDNAIYQTIIAQTVEDNRVDG